MGLRKNFKPNTRSPVSETGDRYLLVKGRVGGVAFWRFIREFIKPGVWRARALQLHGKAYMYMIPVKAVDLAPGYIVKGYAMVIEKPRIVYWPAREVTIINDESGFEVLLKDYFGKNVIKVF